MMKELASRPHPRESRSILLSKAFVGGGVPLYHVGGVAQTPIICLQLDDDHCLNSEYKGSCYMRTISHYD
jgi:hypothetical protein